MKAFIATQKSKEGEAWFESWQETDWDEYTRWVSVNVLSTLTQRGLLNVVTKMRERYPMPYHVPGLEFRTRIAWRESLNTPSIYALSSMRPQRDADAEKWATVNLQTLVLPYSEGMIGRISGVMGAGKTNLSLVLAGLWLDRWPTHEIVTNIPTEIRRIPEPDRYEERIHYADTLSRTLAWGIDLAERRRRWIWVFDELANAGWLKSTATSNVSKDMATFVRNIRKIGGNMIVIDQLASGFPSIVQEFADFGAVYECYKPVGIVKATVHLENGHRWSKRAVNFPKSVIPFETYNQSALRIDFRIPDLLRRVNDAGRNRKDQLRAMREFLQDINVPLSEPTETAKEEAIPEYLNPAARLSLLADEESSEDPSDSNT